MNKKRLLVACEYSGIVREAFNNLGCWDAWSCDILPTEQPGNHFQCDVFEIIDKYHWDLMIGHPPCTDLANAGAVHFKKKIATGQQQSSIDFFLKLYNSDINFIAIENPVGIMSTIFRKPDQIVEPYYFGDNRKKATHLWLKNLPKLIYSTENTLFEEKTSVIPKIHFGEMIRKGNYRNGTIRKLYWLDMVPKKDRGKIKSKTFPGIANAMAQQWTDYIFNLKD